MDSLARQHVSNGMILEAASAMQLEQEELDDERRMEMAMMGDDYMFGFSDTPAGCAGGGAGGGSYTSSSSTVATPGLLPDTGSELTHGSSVVLAGSMASAMMRRRRNSPQLRPPSHEGKDSSGYTVGSSGGKGLDDELVLKPSATTDTGGGGRYFLGEGDVSSQLMTPQEQLVAQTQALARPASSGGRQRMSSPRVGDPHLSTCSSPSPGRTRRGGRTKGTDTAGTGGGGGRSVSGAARGGSRQRGTADSFDDIADEQWASFENDDSCIGPTGGGISFGGAITGQRSGSSHGSSARASPLDTATSTSSRLRSPVGSNGMSQLPPTSPHTQMNASRPPSVSSPLTGRGAGGGTGASRSGGIASAAPSAPFKVLLPPRLDDKHSLNGKDDNDDDQSGDEGQSRDGVQGRSVITATPTAAVSIAASAPRGRVAVWDVSDDSDSSEGEIGGYGRRRSSVHKKNKTSNGTTSGIATGKYKSLVHRDSVLRGGALCGEGPGVDKEALAVDHASRWRMTEENVTSRLGTASGLGGGDSGNGRLFSKSLPGPLGPCMQNGADRGGGDSICEGGGNSSSSSSGAGRGTGNGRRNRLLEDVVSGVV